MNLLKRYEGNPIIAPKPENKWEASMTFNAGAVYVGEKVHIFYRGQEEKTKPSSIGYAVSSDGIHINERLPEPIIAGDPNDLRQKKGCEDPRVTLIGDRVFINYSVYGFIPNLEFEYKQVQLAMSSISVSDLLERKWNFESPHFPFPNVNNKGACLFPEKINGKWIMYHRIPTHIWIGYSDDMKTWYDNSIIMQPEQDWERFKLGTGAPPIKTDEGWLIIYHAVDAKHQYRLGVALVDLNDPSKIIARSKVPFLEPEKSHETNGFVPNVVFTCGAVVIDETLYLYYCGADTVLCVAMGSIKEILDYLL